MLSPRLHRYRRALVVLVHLCLVVLSSYLAFWLRFDGAIPPEDWDLFVAMLPWLLLVRGVLFVPFRLYEGLWRYTSIRDLRDIILGVATSGLLFYLLVHWGLGRTGYPRSVFVIDAVVLIFFMGGIRLTRRVWREMGYTNGDKRILIYGAGDAGEMIVRDMRGNVRIEYEPIGFIDDDRSKVGQRIHGIKVLGTRTDLPAIIETHRPDAVLLAMPGAAPSTIRKLVKVLEPFKIPIKTVPNFRGLQDAKVTASQIRNLSIEDLLERAPVGLDPAPVRDLLRGKAVLVTGAGGSIGSELCRQILACKPASLVVLDRYENGLYAVATELAAPAKDARIGLVPLIGDVTDADRMKAVMGEYRPQIVLHAAAHKHVPLMETSPCEAVKNNVRGTRIVAEAAVEAWSSSLS